MDDDALIPPASPWPTTGGHFMAVMLHLVNGALLIGVTLFSPPWAGLDVVAALGPRFAGITSDDVQWSVTGMIVFATVISIVASSVFAVAGFRLVARIRGLQGARRTLGLTLTLALAHGLGCLAGIAGVLLATGVAFVG